MIAIDLGEGAEIAGEVQHSVFWCRFDLEVCLRVRFEKYNVLIKTGFDSNLLAYLCWVGVDVDWVDIHRCLLT